MDKIIRTLIAGGAAQIALLDVTELTEKAVKIHSLTPDQTLILGELLCCGAFLASDLKSADASVSLTIKAKDGDGAVSVSADGRLHIRGFADGSCKHTIKGGNLTVVRQDGGFKPFTGTCEIESDGVDEALAEYYQVSEQIPAAVKFFCQTDQSGKCLFCGGAVIRLLPAADDGAIEECAALFDKLLTSGEDFLALGAEGVYKKYVQSLAFGEYYELFPKYKCNCSRQKIQSVLAAVGREELTSIIKERGKVSVHCHYCNTDYDFDQAAVDKLFE